MRTVFESYAQQHAATMARYNTWMNANLYSAASKLDDAARKRQLGAFFGSLHGTLNHLVLTDRIWLTRFMDGGFGQDALPESIALRRISGLDQVLFEDFDELRGARVELDRIIEAWAGRLDEPTLRATFEYASTKGVKRSHALWLAVVHLFNHQTHHRGQATTLLYQLGVDLGVTDLIYLATS